MWRGPPRGGGGGGWGGGGGGGGGEEGLGFLEGGDFGQVGGAPPSFVRLGWVVCFVWGWESFPTFSSPTPVFAKLFSSSPLLSASFNFSSFNARARLILSPWH